MLPRQSYHALDSGTSQSDESETLQADVMRFMAILGLCLMVIFALVQSLPNVPADREGVREQAAAQSALMREINELRVQVSLLSDAARSAQESGTQLQDTINNQEQVIAELEAVLSRRDILNNALSEELASLGQEVSAQRQEAQRQQAAEVQLSEQLARITDPGVPETLVEDEVQAALAAEPAEPTEDQNIPEPTTSAADEKEEIGFRLQFASDDAFFHQVSMRGVDVYVQSDKGGFKLKADGKGLVAAQLPAKFQKINANSLPSSLATVLKLAGIDTSAQWGVVLSRSVLAAIDRARADSKGGLLIIEESGGVTLR